MVLFDGRYELEISLIDNTTNLDFTADFLDAGDLNKDIFGRYLVDDCKYIADYAAAYAAGASADYPDLDPASVTLHSKLTDCNKSRYINQSYSFANDNKIRIRSKKKTA